jgi:hypothetical protein
MILVSELALQGKILQVPETLSWKRVRPRVRHHQSSEAMLEYMGGSNREARHHHYRWLPIFKECVAGLFHAGLPLAETTILTVDAIAAYFAGPYLEIDAKERILASFPSLAKK